MRVSGSLCRSENVFVSCGSSAGRFTISKKGAKRVNDDFLDLLCALNDAEARYLVVGGYAVGVHGHPRATTS
jgi:hypothetical protein